jgi:hypothetical protein
MDDTTATAAPQQQPAPAEAGENNHWAQAAQSAQGAAAAKPAAAPAGQAGGAGAPLGTGAPAQAPPPQVTTAATPPPDAKPVYPPGLRGFIDRMVDGMAGTPTSRVRKADDGSIYLQQEPVRGQAGFSEGHQWLRIAGRALAGAGAGMAQRGAGSKGQALEAGIQAGQKINTAQTEEQKNNLLQLANIATLNHQIAANALELTRKQVEGSEHDITFSEGQADRLTAQGASVAGHAGNLQELTKFMRDTPSFNKDQAQTALYVPVATYGADGKPTGFDIYKKMPGSDEEMLPPGQKVPFFNPVTNAIEYQKTVGPMRQGDVNAVWAAAGNAQHKYQLDEAERNERNANANAKNNPKPKEETASERAEHEATANARNSEADLNRAKKKQIETGKALDDGTPNPRFETMANALLSGDILPADLKREAKGANLDPNEVIGRAMEIAEARGEHFSLPIVEQEHKFASSPKTQAALDGMDRILGSAQTPGYLDRMLETAKKAHLASGPMAGAQNNLVLAARRFFGEHTAKDLNTQIEDARSAIQGLIGNPLLGGGETDKKLAQAERMLGASPTLENLTSASQILKTALQTQRQSIVGNNRYLRQRYGSGGQQEKLAAPAALTNLHQNPQTGQTIGWNGSAYVDATTGKPVQ